MLIKKKRCAFLASVKPEKLNGSHAIAWAAITISSYIGFLRAYTRRRGIAVPRLNQIILYISLTISSSK